mmetsp:Transcript_23382/g.68247  ORF Transcript_23382/g.68247 Transcript_23382/m.68247 type:complete len:248 (+) Transcript_23382:2114-2857(+)
MNRTSLYGPPSALSAAAPPLASAGKNLRCVSPSSSAASISLAVAHPGTIGTPRCVAHSTTRGLVPGETRNDAPAATACSACSAERTVPAPTAISGTFDAISRRACIADGVRKTSSITSTPPRSSARATGSAASGEASETTGTSRVRPNRSKTDAAAAWKGANRCGGAAPDAPSPPPPTTTPPPPAPLAFSCAVTPAHLASAALSAPPLTSDRSPNRAIDSAASRSPLRQARAIAARELAASPPACPS